MPQLICKNLTMGYEGNVVVSDLSFLVEAGDYLCIVGENGSGKTTLMRTILGLKTAISGEIQIDGATSAKEIGYMPQQTDIQKDFPASVREVVRSGLVNGMGMRPFYTKSEKAKAAENMEKLGISALTARCYRDLSGGQQQKVLLARALCATRKILLLDEPVAGLDPSAAVDMYKTIQQINNEGTTIIMISHDVAKAVEYASHILHICRRCPTFFGTAKEYMDSDSVCEKG